MVQNLEIHNNRLVLLNPNVNSQKIIKKRKVKTRGSQSQQRTRFRKKHTGTSHKKQTKMVAQADEESKGNDIDTLMKNRISETRKRNIGKEE